MGLELVLETDTATELARGIKGRVTCYLRMKNEVVSYDIFVPSSHHLTFACALSFAT